MVSINHFTIGSNCSGNFGVKSVIDEPWLQIHVPGHARLSIKLVGHAIFTDKSEEFVDLQADQTLSIVAPRRQKLLRLNHIDQFRPAPYPIGRFVGLDNAIRLQTTVRTKRVLLFHHHVAPLDALCSGVMMISGIIIWIVV